MDQKPTWNKNPINFRKQKKRQATAPKGKESRWRCRSLVSIPPRAKLTHVAQGLEVLPKVLDEVVVKVRSHKVGACYSKPKESVGMSGWTTR